MVAGRCPHCDLRWDLLVEAISGTSLVPKATRQPAGLCVVAAASAWRRCLSARQLPYAAHCCSTSALVVREHWCFIQPCLISCIHSTLLSPPDRAGALPLQHRVHVARCRTRAPSCLPECRALGTRSERARGRSSPEETTLDNSAGFCKYEACSSCGHRLLGGQLEVRVVDLQELVLGQDLPPAVPPAVQGPVRRLGSLRGGQAHVHKALQQAEGGRGDRLELAMALVRVPYGSKHVAVVHNRERS